LLTEEHMELPKPTSQRDDVSGAADVPVREFTPPRFCMEADREAMLEYLDANGYAVVASVAQRADIESAQALFWDFLEALPQTRVQRDDVQSWGDRRDWLPDPSNGIVSGFGFGQSDFMWYLRMLPKVKEAFAAIWRTDDLLVSFDGGNVFRPWKYQPEWLTRGGWFHCDQNARLPDSIGRVCVQGLVTLLDASADTGGLVVVPGSHKQHENVCRRSVLARRAGDFVPVAVGDPILGEGAILVAAKAGDLILWDSRTVHCNTPALNIQEAQPPVAEPPGGWQLIRQVGYVCMTPRKFATRSVLQQRKDAFVQGLSTSHWPHKFVPSGYDFPDAAPKDPLAVSQEQRCLIGYDRDRRGCVVQ